MTVKGTVEALRALVALILLVMFAWFVLDPRPMHDWYDYWSYPVRGWYDDWLWQRDRDKARDAEIALRCKEKVTFCADYVDGPRNRYPVIPSSECLHCNDKLGGPGSIK